MNSRERSLRPRFAGAAGDRIAECRQYREIAPAHEATGKMGTHRGMFVRRQRPVHVPRQIERRTCMFGVIR